MNYQLWFYFIFVISIGSGVSKKALKEPKPAPYDENVNDKNDILDVKSKDKKGKNGKNKALGSEQVMLESFKPWMQKDCQPLKRLLNRKSFADKRLLMTMSKIKVDKNMSGAEKKYHLDTFRIFSQELNETADGIVESLLWLDNVLKGDFKNLDNLKEKSLARLTYLKEVVLTEEQEYQEILEAQEELEKVNQTRVKGMMDQILHDVSQAADELEEMLSENLFNIAVKDGADLETVVKLRSGEEADAATDNKGEKVPVGEQAPELVKLVDSRDNQFVLSKGSDSTVPHEDHHLISDVVYVFFTAVVFGLLCTALKLPTMFGYILAGVLLGPSMLNTIKSQVQIETLGEFGVFFILFVVGLEFSPAQLRKVFRVASVGTVLITGLMCVCGVLLGRLLNTTANESVFVAACLSLSSTPLVFKFLNPGNPADGESNSGGDFGAVLLGILIMQDVLLGLIMAFLPILASAETGGGGEAGEGHATHHVVLTYVVILLKLVIALSVVVFVTFVAAKFVIGRLFSLVLERCPREITLVLTITIIFLMLVLTDALHISMELGCFLAGVMISAQNSDVSHTVEHLVTPLKDFLSVIFFASIGLHVFPTFLLYQVTILTTLTMATVGGKYMISVTVLACLTRRAPAHIKWIVSAGLAQVSEFSFVLGSRARQLGLISREVYLLILSITTLSLLFAPVLWKATVWRLRIKGSQPPTILPDVHASPPTLSPTEEQPPSPFGSGGSPLLRRHKQGFTQA